MKTLFHYGTITDAISELQTKGFTIDFNLNTDRLTSQFNMGEFEIAEVYRYEGDSDPADESSVYAIILKSGIKGFLVTGYGNNSDTFSAALQNKQYN